MKRQKFTNKLHSHTTYSSGKSVIPTIRALNLLHTTMLSEKRVKLTYTEITLQLTIQAIIPIVTIVKDTLLKLSACLKAPSETNVKQLSLDAATSLIQRSQASWRSMRLYDVYFSLIHERHLLQRLWYEKWPMICLPSAVERRLASTG